MLLHLRQSCSDTPETSLTTQPSSTALLCTKRITEVQKKSTLYLTQNIIHRTFINSLSMGLYLRLNSMIETVILINAFRLYDMVFLTNH